MINATIKINKAQAKDNITYSISRHRDANNSFKSVNFTGSLVACKGYYTSDKVNLDREVVEANVGTTLLIEDNELGAKIAKTAKHIYAQRKAAGDRNPTIEVSFTCVSLTPTETNILAKGISNVEINANAQLVDDSAKALANLEKAKSNRVRNATSAAKSALGGLASFIKEVV